MAHPVNLSASGQLQTADGTDTQIPVSALEQDGDAANIAFTSGEGLVATDVAAALDELAALIAAL